MTLPFTRMFLGPMDYTPGAMVNATKETFAPVFERPMSLGHTLPSTGDVRRLREPPADAVRQPLHTTCGNRKPWSFWGQCLRFGMKPRYWMPRSEIMWWWRGATGRTGTSAL